MTHQVVDQWNSNDLNGLLKLLVGNDYGNNPIDKLDEIVKNKAVESQNVIKHLQLNNNDVVVDLGSGCGFIAASVSEVVNTVLCVDISDTFLEYNKKINQNKTNIEYYQIDFGNLTGIKPFNKLYANTVFTQFNLYDCFVYLDEIYKILPKDGKFMFDIFNIATLDIHDNRWMRNVNRYKEDRNTVFSSIYYHNPIDIVNIAKQIGFKIKSLFNDGNHTFFILTKIEAE